MGLRNKLRLTPEQLGQMNRPDLFMEQLGQEMPVVAEPVEADMMPETEISEPAMNTPLPVQPEPVQTEPVPFQTPVPESLAQPVPEEETQQTVTPEPGSTALSRERAVPEEDEYEKLFSKYKEDTTKAREEATGAEEEFQKASAQSAMETGIAGALQSFGEGLAAITGGSAKGLQTGAETLRSVGQQRLMSADRKTRSLKDRLQAAREPLEAKKEEIGFRSVFEKRQAEKRLADPASKESADARDMATNFLDVVAENYRSKGAEDLAARVEQNKAFLENANANQIKEFVDKISGLKVSTDYETSLEGKRLIEREKQEGKKELGETKRDQKLMDVADKEFSTDAKKLNESVTGLRDYQSKVDKFRKDIDLAISGDEKAIQRIAQSQGVISYLIARQFEPKGVFTDNDFKALNSLGSGQTWIEQFQNWTSLGLRAENSEASLKKMKNVIDALEFTKKDPNDLVKGYQRVYQLSNNPFKKQYSEKFGEAVGGNEQKASQAAVPSPVEQKAGPSEFKSADEARAAIKSGTLRKGDKVIIKNKDGTTQEFTVGAK